MKAAYVTTDDPSSAVELVRVLNGRGLPTELHVVGFEPTDDLSPRVACTGSSTTLRRQARRLCSSCTRRPTSSFIPRARNAAASSSAKPPGHCVISVASRAGGIPSAVRDVRTALFDAAAPVEEHADHIWRLLQDRGRYEAMAFGAFDEHRRELSREAQAERVPVRLGPLA